jgi:hypothetical protein
VSSIAKARTTGSTKRRAKGLGRIFRGSFATRGASSGAKGSGASSYRRRRSVALLAPVAAVFVAALVTATALASKEVKSSVGGASVNFVTGPAERFSNPRDVGVNRSGAGPADQGDFYVADDGFHRIQRFDSEGNFISAWGADVSGIDEKQVVDVSATGGTYTLEFEGETAGPFAWNASITNVQAALESLPAIGAGNIGGFGLVEFIDELAGTDVPTIVADAANLEGDNAAVEVRTLIDGRGGSFTGYEVCAVASECSTAVASGANGALDNPQSVAIDNDTGNVYVSDRDNRRVNVYDGAGDFIRSFGWDVNESEQTFLNEEQTVTVSATGGKFTLSLGEPTAPIAYNATAATVEEKLEALSGIGAGGVSVSGAEGGPWTVEFVGPNAGIDIAQLTANATFLTGGAETATVATVVNGGEVLEYEVCEASEGDVCKKGIGSSTPGAGQFHTSTTAGAYGIAVSPPDGEATVGKVFLANTGARRVESFDLDGANPANFGSATQFAANQPRKVAVDSRGVVYASDGSNSGEIERYDSEDANAEGVGFLAPITAENSTPTAGPLLGGSNTAGGTANEATSGLAVDPDTDEGGPDVDELYVLRDPSSNFGGNVTRVQQIDEPGLTAAPITVADEHGAGAGFTTVLGLGLDDEAERLFVSQGEKIHILEENVAPEATLDPVTEFDAHSATFTGTADPNGFEATYRFEYVDDAEFTANGFENAAQVPIADEGVGNGDSPVAVEDETGDNLLPGTLYHARLVVRQTLAGTEDVGGPVTFTTPGTAPSIAGTDVTIATDEATLRGAIDPENEEVSNYHFEWGTTEGYGNTTPVGNLATGTDPVAIAEELTGLTPGQTYHYRLLATNGTGTTTGPDRTFTTYLQLPGLGPKRAYELVSQNPTGGIPMIPTGPEPKSSEDGKRIVFGSYQPIPGSKAVVDDQVSDVYWSYEALRGSDGWKISQTGFAAAAVDNTSLADARRTTTTTKVGLDPDDQNGKYDVYQRRPDGSYVWISRDPRIPVGTPQTSAGSNPSWALTPPEPRYTTLGFGSSAFSASADGKTVVFYTDRKLDDADTTEIGVFRLYKWTEGEGLKFIGARPDGSVPAGGSTLGMVGDLLDSSSGHNRQHLVSRDGSRVIVGAGRTDAASRLSTTDNTIFLQSDGEPSVDVLKETGVPSIPADELVTPTFRGGSADLSRVLYTTSSRLTPDAGAWRMFSNYNLDLYVYDVDADKVRDLTPRLDGIGDPEVDPEPQNRARVRGVPAVSEDGKRVYFVADAQYDVGPSPEGELPSVAGRNLYMAELDGIDDPIRLRFIAALGAGDEAVWKGRWSGRSAYASPDGSVLAFGSSENLTPEHPTGGSEQMFVYDADAHTLSCASCPADGTLPAGEVDELPAVGGGLEEESFGSRWQYDSTERRWVSDDGTVFFDTPTPLVAADKNSAGDAYEFRGGEVRLVSAGTGGNLSKFENASADGSSVFITTADALVPQDEEPGTYKLYVARVGGGFPFTPESPPCDLGAGACEGKGTGAPVVTGAGTAVFEGPGNEAIAKTTRCTRLAGAVQRLSKRAKRLRRAARKAENPTRAKQLRRKAHRYAKAARKRSIATRRCRKAARASNTDRRAGR